jgi:hypothetical protein
MVELKNEDLIIVRGGAVTGALINALARGIETLLDLGRSLGSAIRRIKTGRLCKL